jgi:transcriptional regulator with XRE-family HTH domain/3-methyladenine DNA glycosylase AlkC
MSAFGNILKSYRERAGLSQNELAIQAGLSGSTISRVESGERSPLRKRSQVMALVKALGLTQAETDSLLSAADLAPSTATELSLHPRDDTLYKIAQELEALRADIQVMPAQVRFVEETLLLVLRGARAALPQADLTSLPSGTPAKSQLSEEVRYLDDLLGDIMGGQSPAKTLPFTVLHAAARSPHWELKRRLAEALPALIPIDPQQSLTLAKTLRDDPPDPEWRTDVRRRVIEAMPVLWQRQPQEVAPLLRWREGDEVYAALATLDVLANIGDVSLAETIKGDVLDHVDEEQRRAVALYAEVLEQCAVDPDTTLRLITQQRDDDERLVRICMARPLHRLLPQRTAETLKMMRYVLRQEKGKAVEHQNVRRAVSSHARELVDLLDSAYDESALALIRMLIADQDVHIRRRVCDVLNTLVERHPDLALELIQTYLLQDRDRFVHERTWNALRTLMNQGSERAEELCAQMIEIA